MTSVNEANAITDYKKRLVEQIKKIEQRHHYDWVGVDRDLIDREDVLDLINSTN